MEESSVLLITRFIIAQYQDCIDLELNDINSQLATGIREYILGKKSYDELFDLSKQLTTIVAPIQRLKNIVDSSMKPSNNIFRDRAPGKKTRPWTISEDNKLLAGILKYGIDQWEDISEFVGNGRSKPQCTQRWIRALDPKISRKKWTDAENKKLLQLIEKHGDKKWTLIASEMGNRTDVQCRYRGKQLQKKKYASSDLSSDCREEKDEILVEREEDEEPVSLAEKPKIVDAMNKDRIFDYFLNSLDPFLSHSQDLAFDFGEPSSFNDWASKINALFN